MATDVDTAEETKASPGPAPLLALLGTTVLVLPLLYTMYRSDLSQPGGPSPIVTLTMAIPALPVLFQQRVQNARRALIFGFLAGLVACFGLAALLGFNKDWADYVGIGFGTLVFDIVFWRVTFISRDARG